MLPEKSKVPDKRVTRVVWVCASGKKAVPAINQDRTQESNAEILDERDMPGKPNAHVFQGKEFEKFTWAQKILKIYESLSPKLVQFLRNQGLNKDETDDVIQESFLRLAKHLKNEISNDNLRAWVYRVAHNLAMDIHRNNQYIHEELVPPNDPVDPQANPEISYLQKEQIEKIHGALSQLTQRQYNCILLRTQGLRYREIGNVLGVSEQRAVTLVKRGLKNLMGGL